VPWDQALDIILKSKGLSMRQTGNVIMVAPTQEIAAREHLELGSQPGSPIEGEERERNRIVYSGERLSLNFQDIEVRAALEQLADLAGLNLVASDTVRGNITLRLKNVPWDQVLDIVLKMKGLSMRQTGNVIMVVPTQEIAAQERLELEIQPRSPAEKEREGDTIVYSGDPLPLNFPDIEVRTVLQQLADFAGLNLVASDTVRGNITLRLKNVPWDQALAAILKVKGLSRRQTGNVIMVAPTQEIAAQERLEFENQARSRNEARRNPGRPEHAKAQFSPEVRSLLDEIANPATEPPRRLAIGDRLAELGDPRPGVGVRPDGLPDIAWVEIPAGPFFCQKGERRELPTFSIAKYPITNAQYQCFIEDGGYAEMRWWTDLKRPSAALLKWSGTNRPRTNVTWYEAVAFARWLDRRLGMGNKGSIRLPTEIEWMRAASGSDLTPYPWGSTYHPGYANVMPILDDPARISGISQTSAVGIFPMDQSQIGVMDVVGNVCEWCINKWRPHGTDLRSSYSMRAVRGGSWVFEPAKARLTSDDAFLPSDRFDYLGFRVVSCRDSASARRLRISAGQAADNRGSP